MSDTEFSGLNIWQRINAAARMLADTPWYKDGANSAYKSVTIDQIRREVSKAETEAGIVVHYEENEIGTIDFSGKTFCRVVATLTYVNIHNPDDRVCFRKTAIAQDTGDKGWNKAESMIYKNLYKGLYYIGDREDDTDSLSNEEADLIAVFRDKRFYKALKNIVDGHIDEVRQKQAQDAEEAKKKRRDAMARAASTSDDRMWGSKAKPAPEKKEEPKKAEAPTPEVPEFQTADQIPKETSGTVIPSEQEMAGLIDVWGAMPQYKETVRKFKVDHEAMSSFDLSYDEKVELYTMLIGMGAGQ